jgi:hypothetical protein
MPAMVSGVVSPCSGSVKPIADVPASWRGGW